MVDSSSDSVNVEKRLFSGITWILLLHKPSEARCCLVNPDDTAFLHLTLAEIGSDAVNFNCNQAFSFWTWIVVQSRSLWRRSTVS